MVKKITMKFEERKCATCGSVYYHNIKYNGANRYCHKCYLKRRRIYEQKRNNKFNAIMNKCSDVYWPHVNNKSKIFETGMFGYNGNI